MRTVAKVDAAEALAKPETVADTKLFAFAIMFAIKNYVFTSVLGLQLIY